jgi:UDP:flavonoid glycosyltransferase YjiC (YdhE family)
MGTFLFTAQPSMGHMNPMLAIARQMRADGHDIVFAGAAPPRIRERIASEDFRLINIRPALSTLGLLLLPLVSGYMETVMAIRFFFSGIYHYASSIRRIVQEIQPDAVVADFAFPGAHLAAEAAGIPYVIIYHAGLSFKGPGIPPFGSGLPIGETSESSEKLYNTMSNLLERSIDRAIFRCRRRLGLPPNKQGYLTPHSSPWLTLVLTSEAMEAPRFTLPTSTFFIGPCFTARRDSDADNFPFERLAPDKPKIYVSLGTVFNRKPGIRENN